MTNETNNAEVEFRQKLSRAYFAPLGTDFDDSIIELDINITAEDKKIMQKETLLLRARMNAA